MGAVIFSSKQIIEYLLRNPNGILNLGPFTAKLLIPHYHQNVSKHYNITDGDGPRYQDFVHLGVCIEYKQHTDLTIYKNACLDQSIKDLIDVFGFVSMRNVGALKGAGEILQKNIFPSLTFHTDRSPRFDNQYSLFIRDPKDAEHFKPRGSSSLIVSYQAAISQAAKEGLGEYNPSRSSILFSDENIQKLTSSIILEQRWDAADGIGELCIFNNRTVVHSSYYEGDRGYKIAVKYLT